MAEFYIKSKSPTFIDTESSFNSALGAGLLFGVFVSLATKIFNIIACNNLWSIGCGVNSIASYRIGLIVFGLIALIVLVRMVAPRPIMTVLPVVIIFWNLIIRTNYWWLDLIVYLVLSVLAFVLFSFISRVYNWAIALVVTLVVTALLLLI